jgi:hypothetical protein
MHTYIHAYVTQRAKQPVLKKEKPLSFRSTDKDSDLGTEEPRWALGQDKVCMHVCMYVCMHACMHVLVCVYACLQIQT